MFNYQDPTDTDFLENQGALDEYRAILQSQYFRSARVPNSAFTLLEAFSELTTEFIPSVTGVSWSAFPKTASASLAEIDDERFNLQDEYVEWSTEKDSSGSVTRITFTTEFPEYYEALAEVSLDALIAGIKQVIPDATPTVRELLGVDREPIFGRSRLFRNNLLRNPWNNGQKGLICLAQRFNTLGALFNLLDKCGVPRPGVAAGNVCSLVGGACGPDRNSDPRVCLAAQSLVRSGQGLSLADPAGINILELQGIWRINETEIDINDSTSNSHIWKIIRGGRRGILNVVEGLTLDGNPITSGAQVSQRLFVDAQVISAPETALPDWARIGEENRI